MVFAEYEALPDSERPKSDDAKRDQWMVRFSNAVARDLDPFFQAWGIPVSPGARAEIAGLEEWMPKELERFAAKWRRGANSPRDTRPIWAHCRPMKPFALLALSASAIFATLLAPAALAREVYDLKVYQLKSDEKAALFDAAMEQIGVAAIKQSGASTVGVFAEKPGGENANGATRYVLSVYPSAETYGKALAHDYEGLEIRDHMDYLFAGKDGAAFDRVVGSLLLGFEGFPQLADPEGDGGADRYFELRTYESPSEGKGVLKVEMFNKAELAIFEKVGLESVFYGQAVVAPNLPQLTYMLVYENEAAQKSAWEAFMSSPDWEKLKGDERYADTVSNIQGTLLVALPYSGIR